MTADDERLLAEEGSRATLSQRERWRARLAEVVPNRLNDHPVLCHEWKTGGVFLYGSTVRGVDDSYSDVDLILVVGLDSLARISRRTESLFFDFPVDDKPGHLTVEPLDLWHQRLSTCQMTYVYHLRHAVPIAGSLPELDELMRIARRPLPDHVAHALTAFHYMEMRGFHRSCDNAMNRRDAVALLLLLPHVLGHAMRATLTLLGAPYPYDKWLFQELICHVQASAVGAGIRRVLDMVSKKGLELDLPEADNPISDELRVIRRHIVDMTREKGWDEPWLERWWHYMHEIRATMERTRWQEEPRPTAE